MPHCTSTGAVWRRQTRKPKRGRSRKSRQANARNQSRLTVLFSVLRGKRSGGASVLSAIRTSTCPSRGSSLHLNRYSDSCYVSVASPNTLGRFMSTRYGSNGASRGVTVTPIDDLSRAVRDIAKSERFVCAEGTPVLTEPRLAELMPRK